MKLRKIFSLLIITIILMTFTTQLICEAKSTHNISDWLIIKPVHIYTPLFESNTNIKELLSYKYFDIKSLMPERGDSISWPIPPGTKRVWRALKAETVDFGNLYIDSGSLALAVTYIKVDEFLKASLELKTNSSSRVYLDGKMLKESINKDQSDDSNTSINLKLEPGFHTVVVKLVSGPLKNKNPLKLTASIKSAKLSSIEFASSPKRYLGINEVMTAPTVSSARISPDGIFSLISYSRKIAPKGESINWVELIDNKSFTVINNWKGLLSASKLRWAPDSTRFSYVTSRKGLSTIWVTYLKSRTVKALSRNIKNLGYYAWSPKNDFIIYSTRTDYKEPETGLKKIKSIRDRRHYARSISYLHILSVDTGISHRLSKGLVSTDFLDIHPDGTHVLISQNIEDYSKPSSQETHLYNLNLEDMSTELLVSHRNFLDVAYSPAGEKLLIAAGPSFSNNLGKAQTKFDIGSEFDTQAYIFDIKTKNAEPITINLKPSISSVFWSKYDGNIYFVCADGQKKNLYRYDTKKKTNQHLKTSLDVIRSLSFSDDSPLGLYYGTNRDYPVRIYTINTKSGTSNLLEDRNSNYMNEIKIGRVEEWTFTSKTGYEIDGRVHYPPNFDHEKKWPCIVYFYGGTSPVDMSFGGRYPKNWWAASGYVVYVIQPRGCYGYGQEFSSFHVNDWGKYALEDIIEGVKVFLKEHPFVDDKRVGCLGASYGGFTTELIIAKTDIFAAAISHAGISLLPSYWGGGYWGSEYSGVATAGKYPWNGEEIYVKRSPLFNADKINTPLLLLHGSVDTNVPTHESDYLYTALKLLDKDVEYVKIMGENHWIMGYDNRIKWFKTIHAWFEQWLKGKPDYWESIFPQERMGKVE